MTGLRVGIDVRALLDPKPTGVERVVYHLVESLLRLRPGSHEFLLFAHREPQTCTARGLGGTWIVVPERLPWLQGLADFWIAGQMRAICAEHGLDAFLSPNTKFPLFKGTSFTTVHGLEWRACPKDYRRVERLKQWFWFQLASRFSAGMVTLAEHTAEDVREARRGAAVPLVVVPAGVGKAFRRIRDEEVLARVRERFGIRDRFLLSVCSQEPRKNLERLVHSFARLKRERGLPHQLVLTGRSGWRSESLSRQISALGLEAHVVRTGYVSEEQLVALYNATELFVYPSKYEGFGLPILEAMACGAPVVTSNRSATREVAGSAALLIDPDREESLSEGIALLLEDTPRREALGVAGRERAQGFSWDRMALGVVTFIERRMQERA